MEETSVSSMLDSLSSGWKDDDRLLLIQHVKNSHEAMVKSNNFHKPWRARRRKGWGKGAGEKEMGRGGEERRSLVTVSNKASVC